MTIDWCLWYYNSGTTWIHWIRKGRQNSKIPSPNLSSQITSLAESSSAHPLYILPTMPFNPLTALLHFPAIHCPAAKIFLFFIMPFTILASSLLYQILQLLHNLLLYQVFGTDFQKISTFLLIPSLACQSQHSQAPYMLFFCCSFHARLKTELLKLFCPGSFSASFNNHRQQLFPP